MGRVVVITGANRGLGLEFCRQYLAGGAKVYACSRSPEKAATLLELKQSYGEALEIVPLDVSNPVMLANLPYVIEEPIDILINNAGIYGPKGLAFGEYKADDWAEVLKINTIAPMMVAQALAGKVAASREKKMVLVSSKMGSIADNQKGGSYIYRSSKAAVNAVGKALAIDFAEQGVKVAIVHPGWVQTDMGGSGGLIDAQTSITGLCEVIENLNDSNSGEFFNYDGTLIPW